MSDQPQPATVAITAGRHASGTSLAPALWASTTWESSSLDDAERRAGGTRVDEFYSRYANPTVRSFEEAIAALEGAEDALAFASGMGAVATTVLALCSAGDHIVAQRQLYAGTLAFLQGPCQRFGIDITLVDGAEPGAFAAAVRPGKTMMVLAETPSNHMTPTILAKRAEQVARGRRSLSIDVLGPRELKTLKAGALLAVAQGSAEQPRMIVMRHRPPGSSRTSREVLGLVGKAVTFDTGGISIKPSAGMEEMKMDMAGGAAVIAAMGLISDLEVPVEVLAVVPSTENMPSSTAMKPGDVFTAMNGKTIEVTNTDAEGRLILADALTYCARKGATRIVDMATLTGAIVVAIGDVYAGLFGSDPAFTELVREAGDETGDLCWPMPLHPGYDPLVKSAVADLSNSAKKRQAGAVYAARFLRDFTEGRPWCHVDVAGTAMQGDYASGFGVRLAADVAQRVARLR